MNHSFQSRVSPQECLVEIPLKNIIKYLVFRKAMLDSWHTTVLHSHRNKKSFAQLKKIDAFTVIRNADFSTNTKSVTNNEQELISCMLICSRKGIRLRNANIPWSSPIRCQSFSQSWSRISLTWYETIETKRENPMEFLLRSDRALILVKQGRFRVLRCIQLSNLKKNKIR